MLSLTWEHVWAWRLTQHALRERAPTARLADVVGAVCGIHAQMMPAAELSLGLRLADGTRQAVRAALWETRRLVKTYGLRGTIHLFPANELPLWMAALRTREAAETKRQQQLDLDPERVDTLVAAIADALDGQRLTLRQLGEEVVPRAGAWAGEEVGSAWVKGWPRWRMALGAAATRGQLCFGPPAGQEVTFVRPDQWLGAWHEADPATALAEVLRRYLHAYGPATPRDFAQWFSMPLRPARDLLAGLGDELVEVEVEGYQAYLLAADAEAVQAAEPAGDTVHLLPHFDCYGIGCHPRDRTFPGEAARRALPGGQAGPVPVLLVGGVVAGVWERAAPKSQVQVRVKPFAPLSAAQQMLLEAEAARAGAILEATATLEIGPVVVRRHL